MRGFVLGLDSGGTKTVAAVVDNSGTVVALVNGAGLDPMVGDGWEQLLADLVTPLGEVDAAVLGLPFHGEMPAVTERQSAVALDLLGPQTAVLNDVAVAFEGALAGQDGVLILAGTGSMAWARGPNGSTRSGGWGDAFGDEGSAYWIGREALAWVSMYLDGRKSCKAFADDLLAALGIGPDELITWAYSDNARVKIASVARHVSALAHPDAQAVMQHAAAHLTALGKAAARTSGATASLRWSYAGGVFNDLPLLQAVTVQMGSAPTPPRLPPVGGAVLAAARNVQWPIDAAFIHRLNTTLTTQISSQLSKEAP